MNKKFRGYTLIELLIYMGLLAIFLTVLSSLFGTAFDIFLRSQSTSSVAHDSAYIFSRLNYDMGRAKSIITPNTLGSSSSSLTLLIDNINYTYSIDSNGNLVYTNNLGSFNLNSYSASVSSANFTLLGNAGGIEQTIKVNLVVTSRVIQSKGSESDQINTTLTLRRQQ
jgi:Tfp pilus assembly protein FimT